MFRDTARSSGGPSVISGDGAWFGGVVLVAQGVRRLCNSSLRHKPRMLLLLFAFLGWGIPVFILALALSPQSLSHGHKELCDVCARRGREHRTDLQVSNPSLIFTV